ncbi:MAG: pilus assembly protein N-terminal domain-containing protein [Candidatus Wallbacteria bacterium]|nr:pilus assembly protein N-terminal domain-containing protein [Candidatus Wallbacteria bacterium]
MVTKGSTLTLALLVLLAACAPIEAAPRARKPRRSMSAPTLMAQAKPAAGAASGRAVERADTASRAGTAAATGSAVSGGVTTSASRSLPALTAPAPEEVTGAVNLREEAMSRATRVNGHGERIPDLLRLYPNESKIIKVEGLKRISITNQQVADVVIVSPDEVMVLPNQTGVGGRTSAYFWDKDGRKEIRIVVIGRSEETSIAEQIQKDINLPNIGVEFINNRIILRGKVRNGSEKQYATDISGLYGGQILNLIEVEGVSVDPKEALIKLLNLPDVKITIVNTALQASAAQLAPALGLPATPAPQQPGISVTPPLYVSANNPAMSAGIGGTGASGSTGSGQPAQAAGVPTAAPPATVMVLLEGTVDDEQDKSKADEITRAFFNASLGNQQSAVVINHIEIVKPVQVLVEALLLDMNADTSRAFDFKWGTNPAGVTQPGSDFPSPNAVANPNTINFLEVPIAQTFGQFTHTGGEVSHNGFWPPFPFPVNRFNRLDPLMVQVQWAIKNNKAKLIASPKVVTRSGLDATINVGGTVPLQVPAGLGVTGIQLLRFGTLMRITPTVDHRGNIDTKVNISVSDSQGGGATTNRDTDTRVTVRDGQHIVVSGLVQNSESIAVTKVPFFGDLPWVGRLFQTKTKNTQQRETVAIVTPRLLDAVEKDEMFANSPQYGDSGPSAADRVAANKGGQKAARTSKPAAGTTGSAAKPAAASISTQDDSNQVASTALDRARRETEARVAQLTTASGGVDTKATGADGKLSERQARARAIFASIKAKDSSNPQAIATRGPAKRFTPLAEPSEVPLMTTAPIPAPAQDGASPAWGDDLGGDGAPSPFVPGARAGQGGTATDGLVASASPEEKTATNGGDTATAGSAKDESIDRVSRKIDDLFDKIDRSMAGQAQ